MPRKQKKYHYIYKTTNLLSGKYYIGMHSTHNLDDGYYGSGKRLRYSLNKYGKENHKVTILEFLDSRKELKKREEEIVNLNEIGKIKCLNLKVGGYGGFSSKEHQIKCSIAGNLAAKKSGRNKERLKYLFENDEEWTKNFKEAISKAQKGNQYWVDKKHSEKSKFKMSITHKKNGLQKGDHNSQYGTCWITNSKESKKIFRGDNIPKGWKLGRKIKF